MMNTQALPNGHLPQKGDPQDPLSAGNKVAPPPGSAGSPAELDSANLPMDQDHNRQFHASAYHVPPGIYIPKAHAYRSGDSLDRPHLDGPLPDRCQFMFSDGRQCQMARSDIHPSLCVYHSEREEQLFGEPSAKAFLRGPSYDLPELFSAARDLSTAASVNRALAQVFRLLAQRRISRQEAATFAKLGHLLLQSIRAAHAEALAAEGDNFSSGVIPSILSERSERRISPQTPAERDIPSPPVAHCESVSSSQHERTAAPPPSRRPVNSPTPLIVPATPTERVAMSNSLRISTSENTRDQLVQNEHLQKSDEDHRVCAR